MLHQREHCRQSTTHLYHVLYSDLALAWATGHEPVGDGDVLSRQLQLGPPALQRLQESVSQPSWHSPDEVVIFASREGIVVIV